MKSILLGGMIIMLVCVMPFANWSESGASGNYEVGNNGTWKNDQGVAPPAQPDSGSDKGILKRTKDKAKEINEKIEKKLKPKVKTPAAVMGVRG